MGWVFSDIIASYILDIFAMICRFVLSCTLYLYLSRGYPTVLIPDYLMKLYKIYYWTFSTIFVNLVCHV